MIDTLIEWAHHTLNFWWGCSKVSPACLNCYAEVLAKLWRASSVVWGLGGKRWIRAKALQDAVKLNAISKASGEKQRVFVNSMSDTFEDHPGLVDIRQQALGKLETLTDASWLLLTKRPENVRRMVPAHWLRAWPEHIWIGTTVEDQDRADKRIPELLRIPAKVRFLSCEPMVGQVEILFDDCSSWACHECGSKNIDADNHSPEGVWWECHDCHATGEGEADVTSDIHWVICGGESGPHARPMNPNWARSLRDECQAAGVPFHFKQWGEWIEDPKGTQLPAGTPHCPAMIRPGKKAAGRLLDGREWNELPILNPQPRSALIL